MWVKQINLRFWSGKLFHHGSFRKLFDEWKIIFRGLSVCPENGYSGASN